MAFIDPPLSKGEFRRRIIAQVAIQAAVLAMVCVVWCSVFRFSWGASFFIGGGGAMLLLWPTIRLLRLSHRNPTVIEISRDRMCITLPTRKTICTLRSEIADIHASRPRQIIGLRGRMSSVVILSTGPTIYLLKSRDFIEVDWLVHQLREALGLPVEQRGDRPIRAQLDQQDELESQPPWRGALPGATDGHWRESRSSKFRKWLGRNYNNLGLWPGLFLLGSMLIGFVLINKLSWMVMICLEFGTHAYFAEGVRPVPRAGQFSLSNGHQVGMAYRALLGVLYFVLAPLWTFISLLLAIGLNKPSEWRHERRCAARRKAEAARRPPHEPAKVR